MIEYLVIAAYLVFLVTVGLVLRRFNDDISDYFRNGCKGTWWLVGASAFMNAFSAWTFTGAAGVAYEAGWSVMVIYLANVAGFLVNAAWFAPWFRQLRAITVPQVIRNRFDPQTQQLYAWFAVVTRLLYAALWLYGLAIFCAPVFGYDITKMIVVIGVVVTLYSTIGGSWAVMSTDFLQCLILVPITILIAVLCLIEVGGVGGFFGLIAERQLQRDFAVFNVPGRFAGHQFTYAWALAMFLKNVIGYNTLASADRYFAVKDGREARQAALLAAVLMFLGAIIWVIPPMTARLILAADVAAIDMPKPAEASYALISMKLLPLGMTGLMVVAMFAATISSMDTGLNRNAAIIIRDIYPLFHRGFDVDSPAHRTYLLRLSQACTVALGLVITLLTLYFAQARGQGVFELMLSVGAMLNLPLAVPLLLGMFMRRVPRCAAMVSVLAAMIPSAIGLYSKELFGEAWTFQTVVFTNLAVGGLAFLATWPFWRTATATHRAKVDAFFEQMHRPIDFAREVGQGNDLSQLRILGRFALAAGLFISCLLVLPNPIGGRLCILFVGGFVGLVGLGLMYAGQRNVTPVHDAPALPMGTAAISAAEE